MAVVGRVSKETTGMSAQAQKGTAAERKTFDRGGERERKVLARRKTSSGCTDRERQQVTKECECSTVAATFVRSKAVKG